MNLEFKITLLALYQPYDRVTGPYLRKDGRKHLCLNNTSLPKGDKNKTRSLSWPKAILEVKYGRLLNNDETVDHIDEDFTNDDVNNLQILARSDNIIKSYLAHPARYQEFDKFTCGECNAEFVKNVRDVRGNQVSQGKAGPFCSKTCAGRWSRRMQLGRLAQR